LRFLRLRKKVRWRTKCFVFRIFSKCVVRIPCRRVFPNCKTRKWVWHVSICTTFCFSKPLYLMEIPEGCSYTIKKDKAQLGLLSSVFCPSYRIPNKTLRFGNLCASVLRYKEQNINF
jgi:hypothetical protein